MLSTPVPCTVSLAPNHGMTLAEYQHTNNPPKNDNQRQNQKRNLHARPHSHPDRKIHLILAGNSHGSSMLRCITYDGQKDQSDKGLADIPSRSQGIN